jgi:hypothetical protein
LYDAILKISSDDEKAALIFSDIGGMSGKRLFQSIGSRTEYEIVKDSYYVMQSASLYYLARALEKQKQSDDLVFVACLSYAGGLNAILASTFLPILKRYVVQYGEEEEVSNLKKINDYVDERISSLTSNAVKKISGKECSDMNKRLAETVEIMVNSAATVNQEVRNLAVKLGGRFQAGDFKQARRLYEYVREEINYVCDPLGIEEVQSPETTLKLGGGDCDDKAVLLASLLKSIGFETCFFIADTDNDGYPDHVFTGVYLPDAPEIYKPLQKKKLDDGKDLHDWIPLDPTYEDSDFGVIPLIDVGILKYVPIAKN